MSSRSANRRINALMGQLTASPVAAEKKFYTCDNYIDGKFVAPSTGKYMDVIAPHTGKVVGKVAISSASDVDMAVQSSRRAQKIWGGMTVKDRAQILFRCHAIIRDHTEFLADFIVLEHGKTKGEAIGDVKKGNETLEYATSMPQLLAGRLLEVSNGVECKEYRKPLGVVASIAPFNFPAMVPMWTVPIAIATGNCIIVKPSEKVPITFTHMVELFTQAGLPNGVINVVNGNVPTVEGLCDHPGIDGVTFVGSSRVADIVAQRCTKNQKKVLALGGAKNYLVAVNDCDVDLTARDVVASFAGCSGQRCMAASALVLIGEQKALVDAIITKASAMTPGSGKGQMGSVIDKAALDRITRYIDMAERDGATILLDGRPWTQKMKSTGGFWVGPTVIFHTNQSDCHLREEIFGPVLSIIQVNTREEAVAHQNGVQYGNAACVYTADGKTAQWFCDRFTAGMLGVNIGVPVPREPFSFGGIKASRFGTGDITGDGGIEFFTNRIKVTTKWSKPLKANWMS